MSNRQPILFRSVAMSYRQGGHSQIGISYSGGCVSYSYFGAVQYANFGFQPYYSVSLLPPVQPPSVHQQYTPRLAPTFDREWEYQEPRLPPQCDRFSVLSFNILADSLATEHWDKVYSHIPRPMVDWNWRKKNLMLELGLWSADILCFQEVDKFQDVEQELRPWGYKGVWKRRADHVDGCAIFWRGSRFKLLHEESIEYDKLGLRDNVAQICVFECLNNALNKVVVCNIHILYNPKRGDVKLGQIRALLDRAHAISELWDDAPVVICGDFNCTPKSPLYNFIKGEKLQLSELARDKVSGQASGEIQAAEKSPGNWSYNPSFVWTAAELETATGVADCNIMEHPLQLSSAYAEVGNSSASRDSISGEPIVTCYNKRFQGTVDYIWHSKGLQTVKVLAPISKHVVEQFQGFPTEKWPSDHVALVSHFAFTRDVISSTLRTHLQMHK